MPDTQPSQRLAAAIRAIPRPRPDSEARAYLNTLTKPLGSLGRLEDLAARLHTLGLSELRKAAYVFAADHGLAAEGVSAYPSEVTRQMVLNFLRGGAAINVLGRLHGAAVHIVDAGVSGELPEAAQLTQGRIQAGSRNMLQEPAMSENEFAAALELGLDCAEAASSYNLIAVGEMGIGNTSAASVLTAWITGRPLEEVTGRGTGLDDAARERKIQILSRVLTLHGPYATTPAEALRRMGGLEIAAMTGFMIGTASRGAAVLVDGFISTISASFALAFAPAVRPWLFSGHCSLEPGHRVLLHHLGLEPILDLRMRLGEGTGAVLAMPILESALALYREMATFSSAGVSEAGA